MHSHVQPHLNSRSGRSAVALYCLSHGLHIHYARRTHLLLLSLSLSLSGSLALASNANEQSLCTTFGRIFVAMQMYQTTSGLQPHINTATHAVMFVPGIPGTAALRPSTGWFSRCLCGLFSLLCISHEHAAHL